MQNEVKASLAGFERRMTLRLYAFGVAVVIAQALIRHFCT